MSDYNSPRFDNAVRTYSARIQSGLRIKGFQCDGIFGNIGEETGGLRLMQEGAPRSGRGGYSWLQWTGARRIAFETFCKGRGLDLNSDEAGFEFLIYETLTSQMSSLMSLRQTKTRDAAVRVWMELNERPYLPTAHLDVREKWAERAELIRVQTEKATMNDGGITLPNTGANAAPSPVLANTPATLSDIDRIVGNAVGSLEKKLETLLAAQATSHGVPPAIVALAESLLAQVDIPSLVVKLIHNVNWGALVSHLLAGKKE